MTTQLPVVPGLAAAQGPVVPAQPGARPPQPPRRMTQYELAAQQLAAMDAWHARRRIQQEAATAGHRSREQRLDLARRMDVIREQHRGIVERTDAQLHASAHLLYDGSPRVLVVHRNAWFADKLSSMLGGHGLAVVAALTNGAEAVGVAVAEQPELLLVEETLPMLSGADVIREVLDYSPGTVIVAQVAYEAGIAAMLAAGARAAYARRVPPADVAAAMVGLLERQTA